MSHVLYSNYKGVFIDCCLNTHITYYWTIVVFYTQQPIRRFVTQLERNNNNGNNTKNIKNKKCV